MIDTMAITLKQEQFRILDHNRFSPSTINLFTPPYIKVTGKSPFISKNNPTKKDKEAYGYLPRLTVIKALRRGGFEINLKIEFSIPKVIFGNNFNEVTEKEKGTLCFHLSNCLQKMGVEVIGGRKTILNAQVSSVHYSKNILLEDFTTPSTYIKELAKVDLNRHYDLNKSDYRNSGYALKYHLNNYEVIFYDKIQDLKQAKKSEKKAIEKDNYCQLGLFDVIKKKKKLEVLRMEIRIGNRKKLKQVLKKNNFGYLDLTLDKTYSENVSKTLLVTQFTEIEGKYPKLPRKAESPSELVSQIQLLNPGISLNKISNYLFATELIREVGTRGLREILDRFGERTWYRYKKVLDEVTTDKATDVFRQIKDSLSKFEKIKLDLEELVM